MSLNNAAVKTVLPPEVDIVYDEENNIRPARFNRFSSKASGSLGASQPSSKVVKMALGREGDVKCVSVPDGLSMQTLISFIGTVEFLSFRSTHQ